MGLFRRTSSKTDSVTGSLNSHGLACFELKLWRLRDEEFASALVSSALEWFWTSDKSAVGLKKSPATDPPETRPLTHLCQENLKAFFDDLHDYRGGEGPQISMIALQPGCRGIVESSGDLAKAIHSFATGGGGPVQVMFDRGDDGDEVFYAAWPMCDSVRSLVAGWLIKRDEIREFNWGSWQQWNQKWLDGLMTDIPKRAKD
jgi:hypothetical protein